jgi:transposase
VASVVVDKFAWHNPLYRQAQIMKLQGLPVDRSTLAFWVRCRGGGTQADLSAHEEDSARLVQDRGR